MQSENINNMTPNEGEPTRIALALEMAMLKYGREHSQFITNSYQWFAKKLGYKSKNYIYKWFDPDRKDVKIGFDDIRKILRITQDQILYEVAKEELESTLEK